MIAYERLEVYQVSLDCVEQCLSAVDNLPPGYSELRQQLRKAIFTVSLNISVSLNIAEGAGKTAPNSKRNFYEIAKGSAMESAAILDILHRIKLLKTTKHQEAKKLLHRCIAMLTQLCINLEIRCEGKR